MFRTFSFHENKYFVITMIDKKIKPLFPMFLKLESKKCMVIGGGKIGTRKVLDLLNSRADVAVLSPELSDELQGMSRRGEIKVINKRYSPGDLSGYFLVIDATGDPDVAEQVVQESVDRGILLNVVDRPEQCDFYVPSVHRQGHLTLAASSNGVSPALVKSIRKRWGQEYGPEYAVYLNACERIRRELKDIFPDDPGKRQKILKDIAESDILPECRGETEEVILEKMRTWIF
jgi:precorrin-2 dehydrogenase/sirohydrochlorin ferrochelatase